MTDRLTDRDLIRVVAEVERMSRSAESELSRQQVQEILVDLGLSSELLDDAIVQLQRQDALAAQTRQRKQIIIGVIAAAALGLTGLFFIHQQRQQALNRVDTVAEQVTVGRDGNPVTAVNRQDNAEVFYQVSLTDAPVGRRLPLTCDWASPSGQILHQNSYQTNLVTTPVWQTRCKYQINATAEPGMWTVTMKLGDRVLDSHTFQVD
ncbi:MAG: DUF3859 domain-containing protein [Cyanobacteria bacterium P01_F01_bin.150]